MVGGGGHHNMRDLIKMTMTLGRLRATSLLEMSTLASRWSPQSSSCSASTWLQFQCPQLSESHPQPAWPWDPASSKSSSSEKRVNDRVVSASSSHWPPSSIVPSEILDEWHLPAWLLNRHGIRPGSQPTRLLPSFSKWGKREGTEWSSKVFPQG